MRQVGVATLVVAILGGSAMTAVAATTQHPTQHKGTGHKATTHKTTTPTSSQPQEQLKAAKTELEEAQRAQQANEPARLQRSLATVREHLRNAEGQSPKQAKEIRQLNQTLEKAESRAAKGSGQVTREELTRAHQDLDKIIRSPH